MKHYKKSVLFLFGFLIILLPLQLIFKINIEETYPSFNFPGFSSYPIKDGKYIKFTKTTSHVFFKDGADSILTKNDYLGDKIPRTIQITLIQNLLFPKEYPVLDSRINSLPLYKKELYLLKKSILNRNIKKVDLNESKKFIVEKLRERFPDKEVTGMEVINETKDFDITTRKMNDTAVRDTVLSFRF
ncbi:hypothetical protein J2787_002615 [Chryseobacterium rhizosphaerae]|uniref:Uncharacterized protein n=1 Tax=Chryseobacterium rhizosphaerae TaxID=395937 RepID=A0AAE4C350_9FLAO|nr:MULTISPECIES: hypothetical protein [Chryseobacterium]MBL3550460.1 hypothetical protein [Chryseobacterium sp. KMC2]MDR6527223.1 hypothetical protein [Chryseobacterium rhizosphaerae]